MSNPSTNDTTPTTTGDAGEPTTIFPGRPLPSLGNGEDMQGLVSGVLVATFVIATLFILVRMYCKLLRYRALTFDDYILLGAWVAFGVSNGVGLRLVALGLGKHVYEVPPTVLPTLLLPANLSITFGVVALAWSKTSFAVTLIRVLSGWEKWTLYFAVATLNVTHAISAILPWVSCRPIEKSWSPLVPGTCQNPPPDAIITYNTVVNSYAGTLDLIFVGLAWKTILSLQMKMREKVGVALAMSMGIFAAICTFVKCTHLRELVAPDFTYNNSPVVIWTAAEIAAVIAAACVPSLRILVRTARSKIRERMTHRSHSRSGKGMGNTSKGWYGVGSRGGTNTKLSRPQSWSTSESYLMRLPRKEMDKESQSIYVDREIMMEWSPRVRPIRELEEGEHRTWPVPLPLPSASSLGSASGEAVKPAYD